MKFYTEIANYYDEIFKKNENQINFLKELAGDPPKYVLDVASGTGENAIALNEAGHMVTAIDLNRSMINALQAKSLKVESYVMNMLHIDNFKSCFDLIYCVGNSVVHLENEEEVLSFFKKAYKSLNEGGKFAVQIINYDRVLDHNVKSLPTIVNEERGITFERYYDYNEFRNKIEFRTVLKTQANEMGNKVYLLPIRFIELESLLMEAGFKNMEYYGSFKKDEFNPDESFHLISVAYK